MSSIVTSAGGSRIVTPQLKKLDGASNDLLKSNIPDSTSIVTTRYNKDLKLITAVQRFAESYLKIATNNVKLTDDLSKNTLSKDLPNFEASADSAVSGSAKANNAAGVVESRAVSPIEENEDESWNITDDSEVDLNVFVYSLRRNITLLYNTTLKLQTQIKGDILPRLKTLYAEVEARKKDFAAASAKHSKAVAKCRDTSSKDVARLQGAIGLFNSEDSRTDYKRDPYFLKRSLMKDAVVQVQNENDYVDFLENNERALKTLEAQILSVLRQTFRTLTSMVCGYYGTKTEAFQKADGVFKAVSSDNEWHNFISKNSDFLVVSRSTEDPEESDVTSVPASLSGLAKPANVHRGNALKRNYEQVQFAGRDDSSTVPILEGNLLRNEGQLKKKYSSYYYVITQSKYFLEFPTASLDRSSPTLVLYLPDCLLSKSKHENKFKFTIRGKDQTNLIAVRKRAYSFRASSSEEFLTWYNVVSEVTGLMVSRAEQDEELRDVASVSSTETFESAEDQTGNEVPQSPK